MPTSAEIDIRVRIEGKDYLNQYSAQRADFIQDTCVHISTALEYEWQKEAISIIVPADKADWINLPPAFNAVKNVKSDNKVFEYLTEQEYSDKYYMVSQDTLGYYRLRYNNTANRWQIALVNGPVTGSTVIVLIKKFYSRPEDFPVEFKEPIVCGAVARFCEFLEGDDLEFSQQKFTRFSDLTQTLHKQGSNKVAGQPRRSRTYQELNADMVSNRYYT